MSQQQQSTANPNPTKPIQDRREQFRSLADAYQQGFCVMRPGQLSGHARRLHMRATILEDHASRIDEKAGDAQAKFEKLAGSPFSFFRGTSLLFHRDMAGEDAHMPTVLLQGDLHPENFGIMPNADNTPIFSVNDFDDVYYGPFTWDLKRGTTGFMLGAREAGGFGVGHQRKIARRFIEGYIQGTEFYATHETEDRDEFRIDNSPPIIQKLFDKALKKSRKSWLWDRYLDDAGLGFRSSEELTPISHRREEFQKYLQALAKKNRIRRGGRAGALKVKDVAIRHGQGTASLGLERYYLLVEGPLQDASDDLIIEFKRARRSALDGLIPSGGFHAGEMGDRIAHGQSVHLANGDVFYGEMEIDGLSFMTRERAPFRKSMKLEKLSKKAWKAYAHACGQVLALAHARSDDAGQLDYDIEPAILEAMGPTGLFIEDTLNFASEALERLLQDHDYFRQDHALGAFTVVGKVYR